MLQHLLYLVAPSEWDDTRAAMERLDAEPQPAQTGSVATQYVLQHRLFGDFRLHISFLLDLDAVAPHMRQNPVDLLVYDERGENRLDALNAIRQIKHDVKQLGDMWGPDFYFPMSRVVAVLREEKDSHQMFELGRLHVRDVYVGGGKTPASLLRWLKDVLYHGIMRQNRVGVALSGGGLEGFMYQLGVLYALEKALKERNLKHADIFAGVSSGAIAGSMLACGVNLRELILAFHGESAIYPDFTSATAFDLAGTHIIRRAAREFLSLSLNIKQIPAKALRSIPTGFFKGENLENYFKQVITTSCGHDTFESLKRELYVGATDQDSFEHVTFGIKPHDKVAISEALRASCSFPPIFAPKGIQGRRYIDGQVTKSCNLEIVIERGARLLFVIDPLKPLTTAQAGSADEEGGLFGAIQTIKALVSTRFEQSLYHITSQYPDVDVIVFQPDEESAALLKGSPMRYRLRTQLIESAYRGTLRRLRERYPVYSVKMGRYGFHLKPPQRLKELESTYHEILHPTSQRHVTQPV